LEIEKLFCLIMNYAETRNDRWLEDDSASAVKTNEITDRRFRPFVSFGIVLVSPRRFLPHVDHRQLK
jgi:hypothetical protein